MRRVLLHEGFLDEEAAYQTYKQCFNDNPALQGKLAIVQSCARRICVRKRLEGDGRLQLLVDGAAERIMAKQSADCSGSGSDSDASSDSS